jgi:hypothetical protein
VPVHGQIHGFNAGTHVKRQGEARERLPGLSSSDGVAFGERVSELRTQLCVAPRRSSLK